ADRSLPLIARGHDAVIIEIAVNAFAVVVLRVHSDAFRMPLGIAAVAGRAEHQELPRQAAQRSVAPAAADHGVVILRSDVVASRWRKDLMTVRRSPRVARNRSAGCRGISVFVRPRGNSGCG